MTFKLFILFRIENETSSRKLAAVKRFKLYDFLSKHHRSIRLLIENAAAQFRIISHHGNCHFLRAFFILRFNKTSGVKPELLIFPINIQQEILSTYENFVLL